MGHGSLTSRRQFFGQLTGLAACLGGGLGLPWQALAHERAYQNTRITKCETVVVGNVPPYLGHKKWLFLKLYTNDGLIGLGERPTAGLSDLNSQVSLIQDLCERFVIGSSPFDIEKIWQTAYNQSHDLRNPGLHEIPALSAIEMACWDLAGKAVEQPIYNLLGGKYHDRLPAYRYLDWNGLWENPELAGERAAVLLDEGMVACKIDPFFHSPFNKSAKQGSQDFPLWVLHRATDMFRSIREAVGDKMEVGMGTHGQFSVGGAIRLARTIEEFEPFFFEEPVPPENVAALAEVASQTSIPIATGERLVTKFQFSEVLEKRAAHILQLDVGHCGGILEAKKISAIAEAHYATIAPHMFCGPVAAAAAIQLDTCSPNFLIQEYNVTSLHDDILKSPIDLENGFLKPPDAPGLGIELDETVVKKRQIT